MLLSWSSYSVIDHLWKICVGVTLFLKQQSSLSINFKDVESFSAEILCKETTILNVVYRMPNRVCTAFEYFFFYYVKFAP